MTFTSSSRRSFLTGSASFTATALAAPFLGRDARAAGQTGSIAPPPKQPPMPQTAPPYDKATINLIGPRSGYTPHVGTIVTMLTWMELAVLGPTRGLKQQDLDFLFDKNANTIGALMLHLAATEVLYQRMTFNNEEFDKLPPDYEAKWGAAMNLGDAGQIDLLIKRLPGAKPHGAAG